MSACRPRSLVRRCRRPICFIEFDTLWEAGGSLTQPLFKGGALRAQVRAARDAFKAEAATYQAVVLEALGQVADDLWALQYDAEILTVDRHRWMSRLRR